MVVLLMFLAFSAAADLDIWTPEQVESLIPLGSDLNLQPFQAEPETTGTCWILTDGSYVKSEN